MKTKNILSIMLVLIFASALTVTNIQIAYAGTFDYGVFYPAGTTKLSPWGAPAAVDWIEGGEHDHEPDGGSYGEPFTWNVWADGVKAGPFLTRDQAGPYLLEFAVLKFVWIDTYEDGEQQYNEFFRLHHLEVHNAGPNTVIVEFNYKPETVEGDTLILTIPAGAWLPVPATPENDWSVDMEIPQAPPLDEDYYAEFEWQVIATTDPATQIEFYPIYERAGPKIDKLRALVVKSPDEQLIAMQVGEGHVLTDLIRPGDITKLEGDGFTITSTAGFHMGHIGFNIREDQSYKTITNPDAAFVLSDVNFRHALFHKFDQYEIVSRIYGFTVTPVQSLVPPAQGGWRNPAVPTHPYSPGDKTATTEYNPVTGENHDACSILRYGGYLYDAGLDNWLTPYDIDGNDGAGTNHPARPLVKVDPDDVVPDMVLWTPTALVAPTSHQLGQEWVADLNDNGLTSIESLGRGFSDYTSDVFDLADFDLYMVFWSLGRFPDHLETMCHSDHDCQVHGGDYNAPGCHDDELDEAVRTLITSLDHVEKLAAAYKAQNILYNETYPDAAFSYMQLYSRFMFNSFNPDLRGIVNSPGYGSANDWTYLNIHWDPGTERYDPPGGHKTIINWIWGEEPELLNPCSADTVYAWDIMDKTLDGLITVNPYTHEDKAWMAKDWEITEWPNQGPGNNETWMNVTFYLRQEVFWQDGNEFTAEDAKFNWLFLRDNQIPRYMGMWQFLVDVDAVTKYKVVATLNVTSQFLIYDLSGTAALLAPPVWAHLDGQPLNTIMTYNPGTNHTKPTGAGPWFGTEMGASSQLYGTGAFVFEYWDGTLLVADLHQFPGYHHITIDVQAQKVTMFHRIGDVDRDGYIDVFDLSRVGLAYGKRIGKPGYDPDADLNEDDFIDARDLALVTFNWGEQREYPVP